MRRRKRFRAAAAVVIGAVAIIAVEASPTAVASPTSTAGSSLSGTWAGRYGGTFHGTFTLRWRQTNAKLKGTIKLSTEAAPIGVTGSVKGNAIRFGTVGSAAITYSGSISGSSMSGHYHTPAGNGSWSAHKTS